MKKSAQAKLVIFGNPQKERVADVISEFIDFAKGKAEILANCGIDECKLDMPKDCDFAIVFGGDGSIISVARQLSESSVPIIGVNLGKLGFLAEFGVEELKDYFAELLAGKASIEKRMLLNCKVYSDSKERFSSIAVNDVFITAGEPFRTIDLKISVDGQDVADCVGDGLIISTPSGSTAYNLSAGGPILSGKMEAMVITPICPHSLSFRPIVINADSKVKVTGVRVNEGSTVSIDGQISLSLSRGDTVCIQRAQSSFLVVNNPARTQWDTLATKLSWAEKPRYKKQ